jgi:hypothetical protein
MNPHLTIALLIALLYLLIGFEFFSYFDDREMGKPFPYEKHPRPELSLAEVRTSVMAAGILFWLPILFLFAFRFLASPRSEGLLVKLGAGLVHLRRERSRG